MSYGVTIIDTLIFSNYSLPHTQPLTLSQEKTPGPIAARLAYKCALV